MTDATEPALNATTPGPFLDPGPRQIQYRHAKRLARLFAISDPSELHRALQTWADIYYATNAARLRTLKETSDELSRVYGAIKKFVEYTRNEDRSAVAFRRQLDNEFRNFEDLFRREFPEAETTPAMNSAHVIELIENAAERFRELSENAIQKGRQAKTSARDLKRQDKNPGLKLLIRNMAAFWENALVGQGTFRVNNRLPDPADKPAVRFAILVARLIDPKLARKTIVSHMQTMQKAMR